MRNAKKSIKKYNNNNNNGNTSNAKTSHQQKEGGWKREETCAFFSTKIWEKFQNERKALNKRKFACNFFFSFEVVELQGKLYHMLFYM